MFTFVTLAVMIAVLTTISYFVSRNIIGRQVEQRLSIIASNRAEMIGTYVDQQIERISLVASRTRMRHLFTLRNRGEIDFDQFRDETKRILEDARNSTEGFREIYIADVHGKVVTDLLA